MEAAQSRVNPSRQSDAIQHFKYSALLPLFEAAADTETESGSVSSDLLYNFIGPGCSGWGWGETTESIIYEQCGDQATIRPGPELG